MKDMQIVQSLQILIETISIGFTFVVLLRVTWTIEVAVQTMKFLVLKKKNRFLIVITKPVLQKFQSFLHCCQL